MLRTRQKILTAASFLSASEVVTQACSLVRNVILARFLAKADFGAAALLGMILTLFEVSGKMALGQQVVQSQHGENPGFVASVQFTQLAAGALSALLILASAWPLAHFFSGLPSVTPILILALIPLIGGFASFDIYRRTRSFNFGPLVISETLPQILITLAAWPVAAIFQDYRAVLCLLLVKTVLNTGLTHLLAERRYALRVDADWLRESLKFGGPLLLSGLVQFGNFQGDSMIVAAAYSMTQLGEYSVALTIAMAISVTVTKVGQSVGLPILSQVQGDTSQFNQRYGQFLQGLALAGCSAMLGMLFCGEEFIVLVFGSKYAGVGTLACWLTAAQTVRILRGGAITAAMARGDTVNNLVSSSWRLSGLLFAIAVGFVKADLIWFAVASFSGELVALAATLIRLAGKHAVPAKLTAAPGLAALTCISVAILFRSLFMLGPTSLWNLLALPLALLLSICFFLACFQGLRTGAASLFPCHTTAIPNAGFMGWRTARHKPRNGPGRG